MSLQLIVRSFTPFYEFSCESQGRFGKTKHDITYITDPITSGHVLFLVIIWIAVGGVLIFCMSKNWREFMRLLKRIQRMRALSCNVLVCDSSCNQKKKIRSQSVVKSSCANYKGVFKWHPPPPHTHTPPPPPSTHLQYMTVYYTYPKRYDHGWQ